MRLCFKAKSGSPQLKRGRHTLVAASASVLEAPAASREQRLQLSNGLRRDTAILQVWPASLVFSPFLDQVCNACPNP